MVEEQYLFDRFEVREDALECEAAEFRRLEVVWWHVWVRRGILSTVVVTSAAR